MTSTSAPSPGARLWRDRNFTTFWAAQFFDFLGDSLALILMPLLVLDATGSVGSMGLVTAAMNVGTIAAGVLSGNLVDRVDRRRLLIACDVLRAAGYALIPLSWALGLLGMGLIFPVAMAASLMSGCFLITYSTVTPRLVDRDQVVHANGRLQASIALSYAAGPMLAGLSAYLFGPPVVVLLVVACYAASAVVMSRVRLRPAPPDVPGSRPAGWTSGFLAGARFLWGNPVLRAVTVVYGVSYVVTASAIDLFVYYLRHDLGASSATVGVAFGVAALGAILGGALTPLLQRLLGFGRSFLGALLLQGAAMTAIGLSPRLLPAVLLITGFSLAMTLRNAGSMTVRQHLTPDHLLGRSTAAFWAIGALAAPPVTALATHQAQSAGVPAVLTVLGAVSVLAGLLGLGSAAHRRADRALAAADEHHNRPGTETEPT